MKKSLVKKIDAIANTIPEVREIVKVCEILTGDEILEKGIKQVEGEEVELKRKYKLFKKQLRSINHARKLRDFYKKFGPNGYLHEYRKHLDTILLKQKKLGLIKENCKLEKINYVSNDI